MAAPPPSCNLLHILRSQPALSSSPASFVSLLKPLLVSSSNALSTRLRPIHVPPLQKTLFRSLSHPPTPLFSTPFSSSSFAVPQRPSLAAGVGGSAKIAEDDDSGDDAIEEYGEEIEPADDELDAERSHFEDTQSGLDSISSPLEKNREERLKLKLPSLTVKERKELASYAHSLGKKLKTQLVGKSGVTSNVATSFIETLEANELLKIKIHRSCPGELDDVVKQLEEATGSVALGQIGRTLIIYRPSLSKLKEEEKKKQARKVLLRKQLKPRLSKQQVPKFSRRGSSWKVGNSRS